VTAEKAAWTGRSELAGQGHRVSAETVADLLREEGFSLQGKELVGNYKNAGCEWRREGEPARVQRHDVPDLKLGRTGRRWP
jgi:hypothetical protein